MLSDRFRLPVYVEHDGNAGALAEFHFGAGRGHRNIIFLTMGTGFGAGLILNGQLYRGTTDVAGEIGHVRVAEEGPPCFGKPGSLEGFCSGTGIALLGEMMFPGWWTAGPPGSTLSWKGGDPQAHAVFDRASRAFGRGLAMLLESAESREDHPRRPGNVHRGRPRRSRCGGDARRGPAGSLRSLPGGARGARRVHRGLRGTVRGH